METLGIHLLTTWTAVWDAQTQTKTHADSNTHCFIIKPQTTISDIIIIIIIIIINFGLPGKQPRKHTDIK